MATNSLKSSIHYYHQSPHTPRRRHSIDILPPSSLSKTSLPSNTRPFSIYTTRKQTIFDGIFSTEKNNISAVNAISSSSSSSSTISSTSSEPISLDTLKNHLSSKNFREADEETRRLLIVLAGEPAQKRGYVFFSEVQFIPEDVLKTIDALWRQHSNDKFGYSVQKRIWQKANKDFTRFFLKVGWMKKLNTEVEQYNYRSFPNEFIWELKDDTPEGHLPLTNALRGTQLLNSILSHPAFKDVEEDAIQDNADEESADDADNGSLKSKTPLTKKTLFKPNYSF